MRHINTHGFETNITDRCESNCGGRTQSFSVDEATSNHLIMLEGSTIGCRFYNINVKPIGNMLQYTDCDDTVHASMTIPYGNTSILNP